MAAMCGRHAEWVPADSGADPTVTLRFPHNNPAADPAGNSYGTAGNQI